MHLVLSSPNDNKLALVQVMALGQTRNKPLPEPSMIQFIDSPMHHMASMSLF